MQDKMGRCALVKVENEDQLVLVAITSRKPEVPDYLLDKWQRIVDLAAGIMKASSGSG